MCKFINRLMILCGLIYNLSRLLHETHTDQMSLKQKKKYENQTSK